MKKYTTETFIEKANNIHNNKYDYSKFIYTGIKNKGIIICLDHGEFLQTPDDHINGQKGCIDCGGRKKLNKDLFLLQAINIHGNLFTYDNFIYVNARTNGLITCKIHGDFLQAPTTHISLKRGCPNCGYEIKRIKNTSTKEKFVIRAAKIHNNYYNYDKFIYTGAHESGIITCPKHGDFTQTATDHLSEKGCRKCSSNISKMEIEWLNSLGVPEKYRNKFIKLGARKVNPDAYDPITNTIYEFYGDFWHGNPKIYDLNDINNVVKKTFGKLYQKTLDKEKLIKENGYNLITIWESDFKKI